MYCMVSGVFHQIDTETFTERHKCAFNSNPTDLTCCSKLADLFVPVSFAQVPLLSRTQYPGRWWLTWRSACTYNLYYSPAQWRSVLLYVLLYNMHLIWRTFNQLDKAISAISSRTESLFASCCVDLCGRTDRKDSVSQAFDRNKGRQL